MNARIDRTSAAYIAPLIALEGHTSAVRELLFSRSGAVLVSRAESEIIFWDLTTAEPLQTIREGAWRMALSPDGDLLALAQETVVLYDIRPPTGPLGRLRRGPRVVRSLTDSTGWRGLAFTPNGRTLRAADAGGIVRAWDTRTWSERYAIREWTVPVMGMAVSADGAWLALGCGGEVGGEFRYGVRLRDIELNRQVGSLNGGRPKDEDQSDLSFSPDGRLLAVNGEIWDVAARALTLDLRAQALAFSAEGSLLACADLPSSMTSGRVVRLIDVRTGQEIAALRGHAEQIWDVSFSPDGRLLASCSGDLHWWKRPLTQQPDKTIRLWGIV